jgi:hypothetical protein
VGKEKKGAEEEGTTVEEFQFAAKDDPPEGTAGASSV